MITDELMALLDKFPLLTSKQVESCRTEARKRILKLIGGVHPELKEYLQYVGDPPEYGDFDLSNSWWDDMKQAVTPLDYLIPPILFVLLMISLTHMMAFSGSIGQNSFFNVQEGFEGMSLNLLYWVLIHQIGFFAMSELGVIYFYTWNSMEFDKKLRSGSEPDSKYMSAKFLISVLFATFTVIANVVSLTHNIFSDSVQGSDAPQIIVLVSIGILIPATTMYLGERLAEILIDVIEERSERRESYDSEMTRHVVRVQNARNKHEQAMILWQGYHQDDTTHPDYQRKFALVIVDYYKRYIKYWEDDIAFILPPDKWTPELERMVAARELANLSRMSDLDEAINFFLPQADQSQ